MKTAIFLDDKIHLEKLNREQYQRIYEAGKKGELACPSCGAAVRLYLGIMEEPHFFHVVASSDVCDDLPEQLFEEPKVIATTSDDGYIERNGFRIPVSRSVGSATATSSSATATRQAAKKRPKQLKVDRPFAKAAAYQSDATHPYLAELAQAGFMLDASQAAAVTNTEGPLLVLAGAGSGKTRVLTARTAFMLVEKRIAPNSIMLVTFTAKAAAEMKERLTRYPKLSPSLINGLVTGTFHSIFYRILAFHAREKWDSRNLLKKDWQKEQILKEAGKGLELDEKEFSYDLALQKISYWKNNLEWPDTVKPADAWEEKVAILYKHYEESLRNNHLFDFDDMLIGCYQLFLDDPALLVTYQNRFQYFLIDELQDINKVQYELIKLLSARSKNVCGVGDDDQSIYAFRGSDPSYLLDFEYDFPNAQTVVLDQNYRSSHEIVSVANKIISQNKRRRTKSMNAQSSYHQAPIAFYPYDEEEEATMILTDLLEKIGQGKRPSDFAILFRTNTGSRAVFERLVHSSIPFKIDQDIESFYDRFIVKGMLAFLRLSVNEDDQHAIQAVLPAMFIRQNALQDIKADSILSDCTMLESLSRLKTSYAFQARKLKKLVPILRGLGTLSPAVAIETVEKELGFADFVKKRGNEGNMLDKGSDDVRDLKVAAKNFTNVAEFLEHTDHMKAMNKEMKVISKNVQDAVTLSTIHRSKGLEYNTVYVLGTVDGTIPHDYSLESLRGGDQAPLEEERRLLYVAVTRAQDELYLSIPERIRGKKANPSRFLSILK
ncbi:ATP-dependent helicase [Bacillus sp. DNRA2]|uniref:UvrD-helicase domain-containing protein n=1 Tax=Bacillus sp. DNRA2 TaxID=2723053 RepID=UPI00145DC88A|nr:ATP-dependent helicase [Bacillus sp. DNRA2]NMD71497.1 ATP-dependent helicase [Bacillus sp. DNRA2]